MGRASEYQPSLAHEGLNDLTIGLMCLELAMVSRKMAPEVRLLIVKAHVALIAVGVHLQDLEVQLVTEREHGT